MVRTRSVSANGAPPQYVGFLANVSWSSCCHDTNRHGPVPTGRCARSGGAASGTIEATGIARNLGKIASGSARSIATAVSPREPTPAHSVPGPAANAPPPRIGHSGQARPPVGLRPHPPPKPPATPPTFPPPPPPD